MSAARLFVAALAAAAVLAAPAAAQTRHALVVGVDRYDDDNSFTPLPFSETAATTVAKLLEEQGYEVTLLTAGNATALKDDQLRPTGRHVTAALDRLLGGYDQTTDQALGGGLVKAGDTVMVVLSGHGIKFPGDNRNYFAPADGVRAANQLKTLIPLEGVVARLQAHPAAVRMMLVEACRNVDDSKRPVGMGVSDQLNAPPGVCVLLSCTSGQKSFQHPDLRRGVFMHFVIEALQGKASSTGQPVTWEDLSKHVRANTPVLVRSLPGADPGDDQNPVDRTNGLTASPVLVKPAKPAGLTVPFRPDAAREAQRRWGQHVNKQSLEGVELTSPDTQADRKVTMEFALVPPGEFVMGDPAADDAAPHRVTLTRPYFAGLFEVSQRQMKILAPDHVNAYSAAGGKRAAVKGLNTDDLPADSVGFDAAREFCVELNKKLAGQGRWTGWECRLPTEAEWEFAARGGSDQPFYFGAPAVQKANLSFPQGKIGRPVGPNEYAPNGFGLYHMHGNVDEWCLDWFAPFAGGNRTDPAGPDSSPRNLRVARGGSFNSDPAAVAAGRRRGSDPSDEPVPTRGFRVVIVQK